VTLDELMQIGLDKAMADIANRPAEIMPHFLGSDGTDKLNVYMTPWRDEADKVVALAMLRARFAQDGIVRYAMVSETWAVVRDVNGPKEHRMPSECPDRQERLMVLGVEYGGSRAVFCDIIREDGKRRCSPPQWQTYDSMSGRMGSLLPKRTMAS
jgi:hypothetical protein